MASRFKKNNNNTKSHKSIHVAEILVETWLLEVKTNKTPIKQTNKTTTTVKPPAAYLVHVLEKRKDFL